MKVLLLSTRDIKGGAGKAVFKLNKALNSIGVDSRMLVQDKRSDDYKVFGPNTKLSKFFALIRPTLDIIPLLKYKKRENQVFSRSWIGAKINKEIIKSNPDIVQLNWINAGFVSIKAISKIKKPIIWRFSDFWPITGGCHLPINCKRYEKSCGNCPILDSNYKKDISYKILRKKQNFGGKWISRW